MQCTGCFPSAGCVKSLNSLLCRLTFGRRMALLGMTPDRFNQCLRVIRWTPINIASALQCELSWIEALEAGSEEVPSALGEWLEMLARVHEASPPPLTYRSKRSAY